jgi:hypothetical protein
MPYSSGSSRRHRCLGGQLLPCTSSSQGLYAEHGLPSWFDAAQLATRADDDLASFARRGSATSPVTGRMAKVPTARFRRAVRPYWSFVLLLLLMGAFTGPPIGIAFVLLAVTLAGAAPLRGRPAAFWPPVLAMLAFIAGFALTAPFMCSGSGSAPVGGTFDATERSCRSIIGLSTSIPESGGPSYTVAVLVAISVAVATGIGAWLIIAGLSSRRQGNIDTRYGDSAT